jgi:hypothetical protein
MTDSTQITPAPSVALAAPKRRRLWPWIVGALVLALVLFVLAAPSFLGDAIGSAAASGFNGDHRGKLELGKLELAWFARQKVSDARLLDPEGKEVARVSLDMPSLADLARSGGSKVGVVKLVANANLVADDAGLSNLQRALEENDAAKARTAKEAASKKTEKESKPTDIGALMRELDLALEISVPQLTWSDSHTRALGKPFELRDTVITLAAKPGQPQSFDVKGKLASQGDAPLAVSGKLHDAFDAQGLSPKASFELQANVSDFPSGLIDALAAQDGLVVALFGERFSVDAKGSGTLDAGRIDANLKGSDGEVTIACELKDRVLQGSTERAVHVTSKLDAQRLQPVLKKLAPAGFEIQRAEGAGLDIAIDNLRVDVGKVLDAQGAGASKLVDVAIGATEFTLGVDLGSWEIVSDELGASAPLYVRGAKLELSLTPHGDAKRVKAGLASSSVNFTLDGVYSDGVWVSAASHGFEASVTSISGIVQGLAQKFGPPNVSLVIGPKLTFGLRRIEVPLSKWLDGADVLASLNTILDVELGAFSYVDRSDPNRERAIEFRYVALDAEVAQYQGATQLALHVRAWGLDDAWEIEQITVLCRDARELLEFADRKTLTMARLMIVAHKVPMQIIDAWVAQDAPLTPKLGDKLDIDLDGVFALPAGKAATVQIKTKLASPRGATQVDTNLSIADPLTLSSRLTSGVLPDIDAQFNIDGLALADGFLPTDMAPTLHELLGDKIDAKLACRGDGPKIAALSCELKAARVEFSTNARIEDRVLHIDHDEWLRLKVKPTPALLDRYAAGSLPVGAKLAFADAEPQVAFATEAVMLPLDAWMPAEGKQPATLADVVRRTGAHVQLALPGLNYEQPALTAGGKPVPIALGNMAISASLTPSKPASVDVVGQIAGAQGGKIALHAKCAEPSAFLDAAPDAKMPALDIDGELASMPTALIDALAAQNGLLVDTLGPTIDVTVRGSSATGSKEPLTLTCKSANASLDLVAQLDDMTLVAKDKQGLSATVPLNPLFSQRVVGKLVPLLVNATKPQGAAPVALQMSAFTLPLDGDMQKVNGNVKLELGEVAYDLLPGLSEWVAKAHLDKAVKQNVKFVPMEIAIKDGVAHYDSLPLKVAGEDVVFKGSYSLVDSKLNLSTQLPLKVLGSAVGKELEGARSSLDPNMLVPITIKGTWNKPKVALGDGFVEKALKEAGSGLLKNGLEGLLGGKKDKKPEKKKDG